jgi:hypothetical protein
MRMLRLPNRRKISAEQGMRQPQAGFLEALIVSCSMVSPE